MRFCQENTVKKLTLLAFVLAGALASSSAAQSDDRISHTPPEGPPWVRNFTQARSQALQSGKPIFLYSTKTY